MRGAGRVLGWDLLRGLCAIAVACYHLLHWQGVANLHAWGSYGVYLFFVLSGASLAYTYAPRLADGRFRYGEFLWVRYMRLAPLFVALVVLVALPWKLLREGWTAQLGWQTFINVTFLFGFDDPAIRSLLVGGWSLGIEAVFYLLFPVLLWLGLSPVRLPLLLALIGLQAAWVLGTAGAPEGYTANAVRYHQVPAFIAYFMGGCLLGLRQATRGEGRLAAAPGAMLVVAGFAVLAVLNPARQGDELLGWHGLAFPLLCFALVELAGRIRFRHLSGRLAMSLGDATYGLYLLHPVLYFGLAFAVFPRLGLADPATWSLAARAVLGTAVLASAFVLALVSERCFERPLRQWSKRRPPERQSDAASISS